MHETRGAARARRIFLECTSTHASRYNTGIQRAVRNLINASIGMPGPWDCTAVIFNGRYLEPIDGLPTLDVETQTHDVPSATDSLRRAFHRVRGAAIRMVPGSFLRKALHSQRVEYALRRAVYAAKNGRRWLRSFGASVNPPVVFRPDDVLVLLDSTWSMDLGVELRRARAAGASVWVVVNDLIPIERPDLAPEGTPILVRKWLRRTVPFATGLIGISSAVANAVRAYVAGLDNFPRDMQQPRIEHFYLGAGLDSVDGRPGPLAAVSAVFTRAAGNVYLVVGTIEPRKNHRRILDAFDRLWREGSESSVLIVGRLGWLSDEVAERIRTHREFGRRLFWLPAASDTELDHAYRNAAALIFASCCEGFGLPLVEAMQYGLPVLASDIEVFREIGGEYPDYFDVNDERSLYDAVRGFEGRTASGERLRRQAQPWLSWAESARMLLDKVNVPAADTSPRTAAQLQTGA